MTNQCYLNKRKNERNRASFQENPIVLRRYNVESDTTERYARTKVEAEYENVDYEVHPIEFSQQIPSGAYVSDFFV